MAIPTTITKRLNVYTGRECDFGTEMDYRASGRTTARVLLAIAEAMNNGRAILKDHDDYVGASSLPIARNLVVLTKHRLVQMGLHGFKVTTVTGGRGTEFPYTKGHAVLVEFSPVQEFVYELRK